MKRIEIHNLFGVQNSIINFKICTLELFHSFGVITLLLANLRHFNTTVHFILNNLINEYSAHWLTQS